MAHVDLDAISAEAVYALLGAIRYAQPLADGGLLDLAVLEDRARSSGVAPQGEGRAWLLERLVIELVGERLAALRGVPAAAIADLDATGERDALAADFATGNHAREAWGILYSRFLSPHELPVEELATRLGVARRTLGRRVRLGCELLARQLRLVEVDAMRVRPLGAAPDVSADASQGPPSTATRTGLEAAHGVAAAETRHPNDTQSRAHAPPADLDAYRVRRIAAWSHPRHRLDHRFVGLTLLLDHGVDDPRGRWRSQVQRYDDLADVLGATQDPALVVIGPPGCGKSSLLGRLELDVAANGLNGTTDVVPFFVSLGRYRSPHEGAAPPEPLAWLAGLWAERAPDPVGLADLAHAGRLLLLLDGLNEIPHADAAVFHERVMAWKGLVHDVSAMGPGNRIVFTCRSLDYSAPLSTPTLPVPQVRVEPLDDDAIEDFLARHAENHAKAIAAALAAEPARRALVRSPFLLRLLVDQWRDEGGGALDPAALFTGAVRGALRRQLLRDDPLFLPGRLLEARDVARLAHNARWRSPYELPTRGRLIPTLEHLALAMQVGSTAREAAQVRMDFDLGLSMIGDDGEALVRAAEAIDVLDEDREADELYFAHQLVQEYFAARHLARAPELAVAERLWRTADLGPLVPLIEALPPAEPLPERPASGWEETVRLAAAMTDDVGAFLHDLARHDLPLAGELAALPDVRPRVPDVTCRALRDALLSRARDPGADVRARVAAGLALGSLGDPRLQAGAGRCGDFLMSPLIALPAGDYPIGTDSPVDYLGKPMTSNVPRALVHLAPFRIGALAVTNAEFARFLAAGGYEDPRWWDSEIAAAWREGVGTSEGHRQAVRYWWRWFRIDPARIDAQHDNGAFSDEHHALWRQRVAMDPEALEAHLREIYPDELLRAPRYWDDPAWNNPAQPVVGVGWPEARAYCRWLAATSDLAVRLPTEAEWEAAARGIAGRIYPGGDAFQLEMGNTEHLRLRRTTPVGVFPEGDTPEGVSDLAGNTWDWTASLWGSDMSNPTFRYPYVARDGREADEAPREACRIVRGGSWVNGSVAVRADFRGFEHPYDRTQLHGFRIAVSDVPTPARHRRARS